MLLRSQGQGKRILMRLLSFVLMIFIAIMPIMIPAAQAVVIEAMVTKYAVEIIAGILIAGGLVVAGSPEVYQIAQSYYDWVSKSAASIRDTIWGWAKNILDGGLDIAKTAIRVSADLWQSLYDFLQDRGFSDGSLNVGSISSAVYTFDSQQALFDFDINKPFKASTYDLCDVTLHSSKGTYKAHLDWGYVGDTHEYVWYKLYVNNSVWLESDEIHLLDYSRKRDGKLSLTFGVHGSPSTGNPSFQINHMYLDDDGWNWGGYNFYHFYSHNFAYPATISYGDAAAIPVSGDLVWPGDDTLVKAPDIPSVVTDADGKEVVVVPDLSLNPADHVADIPLGETGEKVDVPYDTLVDVGTGEQIDVGNPDIPDVPDVKPDVGQGILDKLTDFFDSPSDFHLNFDGFKNLILPDRFPFCIPFDLINSIKVFSAAAVDFHFRIDLDTSYWSVHHEVDLTPFSVPIAFFRYLCVIWFGWILITRTRDMIKW